MSNLSGKSFIVSRWANELEKGHCWVTVSEKYPPGAPYLKVIFWGTVLKNTQPRSTLRKIRVHFYYIWDIFGVYCRVYLDYIWPIRTPLKQIYVYKPPKASFGYPRFLHGGNGGSGAAPGPRTDFSEEKKAPAGAPGPRTYFFEEKKTLRERPGLGQACGYWDHNHPKQASGYWGHNQPKQARGYWDHNHPKQVILGMKWGQMGDYGLILNQERDLSLRKVFKCLPGLNNLI